VHSTRQLPARTIFQPVLDELNRRKAVVFVHPTIPNCCRTLMPGISPIIAEVPQDTTRAVMSLLFSGTLTRCKDVRFIFCHVHHPAGDHRYRAARGLFSRSSPSKIRWTQWLIDPPARTRECRHCDSNGKEFHDYMQFVSRNRSRRVDRAPFVQCAKVKNGSRMQASQQNLSALRPSSARP
jgi:hypothetical protein